MTKEKYLLYIDILGFSDMVRNSPERVRRLYKIIEELNCHNHDAFNVIVFSDTILIYNKVEPFFDYDHKYIVMFLIEFAQNLLYSVVGREYYFRSVLVYGEFEHEMPNHVERFFGKALIKAYEAEKDILSTGLFIHNLCQKYNDIFFVSRYDDEYSFVYLNQSLDRLMEGALGELPIDGSLIEDTDSQWNLAKDIKILSSIYHNMRTHPVQKVQFKYQNTWNFYLKRYQKLLELLASNNFDPNCITYNFDWTEAYKAIDDGFRGINTEPPSIEDLCDIFEKARVAGTDAVEKKCIEVFGVANPSPDKYYLPCGGASVILDIKGNSRLGRFLLKHSESLQRVSVSTDFKKPSRGLLVSIYDMHHRQEKEMDEIAHAAALKVIKDYLDVDGYIESYLD